MASGLLSLKWNNHRTTFFHVLSTVRSKEAYCDVTLACDGKFYPVHKLVLSTCSDYFERMFERTNCKHPIIVLKDIRHDELEALLNYMYVGEVNVLQNELAGLIKAAECLMIKGLAVPDEAPAKESKRSALHRDESPHAKRRKRDDDRASSHSHHSSRESRDPPSLGGREGSNQSQRQSSSASLPNPPPRVAPPPISPPASVDSAPDTLAEDVSQSQSENNDAQESTKRPNKDQTTSQITEVILDEAGVKEEPADIEEEVTETKEMLDPDFPFDPLQEGDSRSDPGGSSGPFDSQVLSSQPQSMDELVAQAIPGSSGLQGNSLWEGEGSLQGFPMESFTGEGSRPPQMGADTTNSSGTLDIKGHGSIATKIPPSSSRVFGPLSGSSVWKQPSGGTFSNKVTVPDAGRKEFRCPTCGYQAISESKLTMHIRKHTGEKPFSCPYCPYKSSQRSNLSTHIKNLHLLRSLQKSENLNHVLHLKRM
ncbi:hypothetical protein SK128_013801 [Halocaridina rubra]|uniref:Longitudinals lacking protein n=1 Tax=Halocaridina rubra TaxID=373956 RepID=A0AAN8WDL6_HALRR